MEINKSLMNRLNKQDMKKFDDFSKKVEDAEKEAFRSFESKYKEQIISIEEAYVRGALSYDLYISDYNSIRYYVQWFLTQSVFKSKIDICYAERETEKYFPWCIKIMFKTY